MGTEPRKPIEPDKIELRSDGWERFRNAVRAAAKVGPKHQTKDAKRSVVVKDEGKR